jgi:DNA-binding CsgD family transcriptional regulator
MGKTVVKRAPKGTANAKGGANAASVLLADAEKLLCVALPTARERYSRLTPREVQVARLMSTGKRNQQIAEELGISPKTLDIHRANLMHKLEARTTASVANLINLLRLAELAAAFGG